MMDEAESYKFAAILCLKDGFTVEDAKRKMEEDEGVFRDLDYIQRYLDACVAEELLFCSNGLYSQNREYGSIAFSVKRFFRKFGFFK